MDFEKIVKEEQEKNKQEENLSILRNQTYKLLSEMKQVKDKYNNYPEIIKKKKTLFYNLFTGFENFFEDEKLKGVFRIKIINMGGTIYAESSQYKIELNAEFPKIENPMDILDKPREKYVLKTYKNKIEKSYTLKVVEIEKYSIKKESNIFMDKTNELIYSFGDTLEKQVELLKSDIEKFKKLNECKNEVEFILKFKNNEFEGEFTSIEEILKVIPD